MIKAGSSPKKRLTETISLGRIRHLTPDYRVIMLSALG